MAQIIYDFLKQGYAVDEIVFELEDIGYDSLTIALALDNIPQARWAE